MLLTTYMQEINDSLAIEFQNLTLCEEFLRQNFYMACFAGVADFVEKHYENNIPPVTAAKIVLNAIYYQYTGLKIAA